MKPRFDHDCDACQFLGQWHDYDLWWCPAPTNTVIARYGSKGPNYASNCVEYKETSPKSLESWVFNPASTYDQETGELRLCRVDEIPMHCIALRFAHLIVKAKGLV